MKMSCIQTIFGLLLLFQLSRAAYGSGLDAYGYNTTVCTKAKTQNGLIAPRLPDNYVVFLEKTTNNDSNARFLEHMYIDRNAGKLAITYRDRDHYVRSILDYNKRLILSLYSENVFISSNNLGIGYSCRVSTLSSSPSTPRDMNEFLELFNKVTMFYSTDAHFNQANHFRLDYIRGIQANEFKGCLEYAIKYPKGTCTYDVSYWYPAFDGDSDSGTPSGYKQTPLRSIANGGCYDETKAKWTDKFVQQSYYYFDIMKKKYESEFEIPNSVYCEGYNRLKPLPEMDKSYVVKAEAVVTDSERIMGDAVEVQHAFHYKEISSGTLKLRRIDFVPSVVPNAKDGPIKKYEGIPITVIFDKKFGASYVIQRKTKKCDVYPQDILDMALITETEDKIFRPSSNKFQYKGDGKCGDVNCKTWISRRSYINTTDYSWSEYRFLNGWTKQGKGKKTNIPHEAEFYFHSKGHQGIDYEYKRSVRYNLYDYEIRQPNIFDFDISPCLVDSGRKYLKLEFKANGAAAEMLNKKSGSVEQEIVATISRLASLSPIRVQDLRIVTDDGNGTVYALFSMLSAFESEKQPIKPQDVNIAYFKLQHAVDAKKFVIVFNNAKEAIELEATDLTEILAYRSSLTTDMDDSFVELWKKKVTLNATPPPTEKPKAKYSSGPLIACIVVMLLVGIALGCLVVIIYFKRYYVDTGSGETENIIHMDSIES